MTKASDTIKYFKSIPSSYNTVNVPSVHYNSHLYNFENVYKKDYPHFWLRIKELTENLLAMDAQKSPRYVFLCGFPGSGKTHLAVGLFKAMVQKWGRGCGGGGPYYINFLNLAKDIIESFQENIPLRLAIEPYLIDKWLFLDDFTSSERIFKKDSLEFQIFRDIILNRWDTESTLVTSTNLEAETLNIQLKKLFGEYLQSRLSDSYILQFPDEDLRASKGLGGHTSRREV